MALITWSDEVFSVGVKFVDDQHKVLVQLINAIDSSKGKVNPEFVNKIINTLLEYTEKHFRDEEQFLRNIKYTGFQSHKDQHLKFEKNIKNFVEKFHEGGDKEVVLKKILEFLQQWLTSHILIEDRAYRDYLFDGIK